MGVTNDNIDKVIKVLRKELKDLPDPSVTLVGKRWKSPYLVLISCIMSLRTKDETTLPASERLFALADNPRDMVKLKVSQVEKAIYPVGFYKRKSQNLIDISQTILDEFKGETPNEIDQLLTLKGVGRKTANLVVTEGFGKPGICVDTHVHRISNRFDYVNTKAPDDTEQVLRKKLPKKYWMEYNSILVLWGQNVCKPISPLCSNCPIKQYCAKRGVEKHR